MKGYNMKWFSGFFTCIMLVSTVIATEMIQAEMIQGYSAHALMVFMAVIMFIYGYHAKGLK
jgi:hypothetical protein